MFKLLPYYTPLRCKHEGTAIRLKRSLLDSWPIVEGEPLRVVDET